MDLSSLWREQREDVKNLLWVWRCESVQEDVMEEYRDADWEDELQSLWMLRYQKLRAT